jgi:hypothetical protein
MNTSQILAIARSDPILDQIMLGVFPSDMLPKITHVPAALIVNLDPSTETGSHWVSLYFDKRCEYFDSYGRKPEILESYILANSLKYTFNNKQVQSPLTSICGQMCIYLLIWRARGIPYNEIVDTMNNDYFVAGFVDGIFNMTSEMYNYDFIANQICKVYK